MSRRGICLNTPGTCLSSIYGLQPFKIRPKTKNWMGHLGFTCVLCNCNMSMYTRLHEFVCICVFLFFSPLRWRRFFGFIYFPNPRWRKPSFDSKGIVEGIGLKVPAAGNHRWIPCEGKIVKHVTFVDSLTLEKKQDTFFGCENEIHQVCRLSTRGVL